MSDRNTAPSSPPEGPSRRFATATSPNRRFPASRAEENLMFNYIYTPEEEAKMAAAGDPRVDPPTTNTEEQSAPATTAGRKKAKATGTKKGPAKGKDKATMPVEDSHDNNTEGMPAPTYKGKGKGKATSAQPMAPPAAGRRSSRRSGGALFEPDESLLTGPLARELRGTSGPATSATATQSTGSASPDARAESRDDPMQVHGPAPASPEVAPSSPLAENEENRWEVLITRGTLWRIVPDLWA